MTDFPTLLQQGQAWWFLPSAIALGALHGLEPGHSKTVMAAFIVAIRGTAAQAVLLALSATVSHTAVVWLVALGGMLLGQGWNAQASEPWFQLLSAVLMAGVGLWMLVRTLREGDGHGHAHDHAHDHGRAHGPAHGHDGAPLDAHAQAHAIAIERRFGQGTATTGQILLFGLTGGLIPCPASITVLLLCLQLDRVALGATLVLGFSVGLAITLVAAGLAAAIGLNRVSRSRSGLQRWLRHAPRVSSGLILVIALAMAAHALAHWPAA